MAQHDMDSGELRNAYEMARGMSPDDMTMMVIHNGDVWHVSTSRGGDMIHYVRNGVYVSGHDVMVAGPCPACWATGTPSDCPVCDGDVWIDGYDHGTGDMAHGSDGARTFAPVDVVAAPDNMVRADWHGTTFITWWEWPNDVNGATPVSYPPSNYVYGVPYVACGVCGTPCIDADWNEPYAVDADDPDYRGAYYTGDPSNPYPTDNNGHVCAMFVSIDAATPGDTTCRMDGA
jgi:hypothetical protein